MIQQAHILRINLTNQTYKAETLDAEIYRKYPGGSALGMYFLLKEMDPLVEPLSPENLLIFAVSPLTGIPISGNSRMNVTTKSPLTGTAGDSQVGGFIPAALKGNGWDAVIFTGKAERPVYVYINNNEVIFKDGKNVWGKTTGEAETIIAEELCEKKIHCSLIGPAGENLVKYAAIMHMRSRANGRNGVGAVMGSKNLKAMVVKQAPAVRPIDAQGMKSLTLNVRDRIAANSAIEDLTINGSAGCVEGSAAEGFLPSYNWNSGIMEDWEHIGGSTITNTILTERDTCFACAIRCKRVVEIEGKVDPSYGGPEYETCATFGSYCGNHDLADICQANQLCNMYGLDTISCGATIAWAMDCFEKGILTMSDTDGIELAFGRSEHFCSLIKKIAYREPGIGNLLAEGSAAAAKQLGRNSEKLVVAGKGQEWPAHMVQFKPNLAILYATNPFGADHQSSEHDVALMSPQDDQNWIWPNMLERFDTCDAYGVLDDNKAKFSWETQKFYSMLDTLCLCQFAWGPAWQLYGPKDLLEYCKYGIGWETTLQELQEIGERRIVMMRLFNQKCGFTRKDDVLPPKAYLPIYYGENQIAQIVQEQFEAALDTYYKYAGWDVETGLPTTETLERLRLMWAQ